MNELLWNVHGIIDGCRVFVVVVVFVCCLVQMKNEK